MLLLSIATNSFRPACNTNRFFLAPKGYSPSGGMIAMAIERCSQMPVELAEHALLARQCYDGHD